MKRSNFPRLAALLAVALLASACAALGIKAETFNEGVAACLSSATSVRGFAQQLYVAEQIDDREAENANRQADVLRDGCDVADSLQAVDLQAAEGKLEATRVALGALRKYLEKRP